MFTLRKRCLKHPDCLCIITPGKEGKIPDDNLVVRPVRGKGGEISPRGSTQKRELSCGKLFPPKVVGTSTGEDTGGVGVVLLFCRGCECCIEEPTFSDGGNLPNNREVNVILH